MVLVMLSWLGVCLAQHIVGKTEADIRLLLKNRRSEDLKLSDEAGDAMSKFDERDIPTLMNIVRKGRTCERVDAAAIIVIELDRKNKDLIPMLVELAKGRSIFSSERDLMCRRAAAFLLAWSPEGIRILTGFLKEKDMFVRRSAMFAFYEHTEGTNFPADSTQAWIDAIPFIVEASNDRDEILKTTADEVLDRFIEKGGDELSKATKKAMKKKR
jgi:HEAT repeat protein